jgi:hypothetical protein
MRLHILHHWIVHATDWNVPYRVLGLVQAGQQGGRTIIMMIGGIFQILSRSSLIQKNFHFRGFARHRQHILKDYIVSKLGLRIHEQCKLKSWLWTRRIDLLDRRWKIDWMQARWFSKCLLRHFTQFRFGLKCNWFKWFAIEKAWIT